MSFFTKQIKTIPEGNYRIIKIGKEALFEFIYESFMEKLESYLNISDGTSVVNFFDIDWEKGEFLIATRNELKDSDMFQTVVDTEKLISVLDCTSDTMFTDKAYIDLSEEEIVNLQNIKGE